MRGDVAQLEEHLLCKQGVVGSSPIISTIRYSLYMDKKDLENLSEQELAELKDSIDEAIENKKYKKSYANTNTRGIAIAWIVVAVIISLFRYFSM